eukprot:COSAG01_NODE_47154_length_393_cov_0.704082_2_plen_48_part_01
MHLDRVQAYKYLPENHKVCAKIEMLARKKARSCTITVDVCPAISASGG